MNSYEFNIIPGQGVYHGIPVPHRNLYLGWLMPVAGSQLSSAGPLQKAPAATDLGSAE